jgi:hypothetical protein
MLFESFSITLNYGGRDCELDVNEMYKQDGSRCFEIVQGGLGIMLLMFSNSRWRVCIVDDLHPIVKQDTDNFITGELIELLIDAIVGHYDRTTERKIVPVRSDM